MYEIKSYDASLDKLTELKSKLGINTISSPISYDGRLTNKYIDLLEEADYMLCLIAFEKKQKDALSKMDIFLETYPNSTYVNTII